MAVRKDVGKGGLRVALLEAAKGDLVVGVTAALLVDDLVAQWVAWSGDGMVVWLVLLEEGMMDVQWVE